MKILHVSQSDSGGNGYFTAKAVNDHTQHQARAIVLNRTYLEYPCDTYDPHRTILDGMVEWADVVHLRDSVEILETDKPVIITFSGNSYRRRYSHWHSECKDRGWFITVSTLDLTLLVGAPWMPNPREDVADCLPVKHSRFTVFQAPTYRDRKGTEVLIKACEGLSDVRLSLCENKAWRRCQWMRAKSHLSVDQFRHGYGNSAIEAWSMGQPVISCANVSERVRNLVRGMHGALPWYDTPENVRYIQRNIKRLKDDTKLRKAQIENSRKYYHAYHHPSKVAARALKFYEMVL